MQLGTMCYLEREGRTLMIHRNKREDDFHKGKYVPPGGKTEPGETPDQGMLREVKEESDHILRSYVRIGVVTFFNDKRDFGDGVKRPDWKVHIYKSDDFYGKQKKECEEGTLEWIANEKVREKPMWPGDLHILDWMERDEYFIGELYYENKKLVDQKVTFTPKKEIVMQPDYSAITTA